MKNKAFTPGPWVMKDYGENVIAVLDSDGIPVINWAGFDDCVNTPKAHKANARLIAVAPELLDVLKELADLVEDTVAGNYQPDSLTTQLARSAIAKAEGRHE